MAEKVRENSNSKTLILKDRRERERQRQRATTLRTKASKVAHVQTGQVIFFHFGVVTRTLTSVSGDQMQVWNGSQSLPRRSKVTRIYS